MFARVRDICAKAEGTYSEVEHARLLGLAEVLALGDLGVGVELDIHVSTAALRCSNL